MSDQWPWWWRVWHRLILWVPVEPVDEINEHIDRPAEDPS